jgi:hypothetical protein
MRPRKLGTEGRTEIEAIGRLRESLPTDKDLANKWHISLTWVQRLMRNARKVQEPALSDSESSAHNGERLRSTQGA